MFSVSLHKKGNGPRNTRKIAKLDCYSYSLVRLVRIVFAAAL
jgi:hypothetical protein